MSVSVGSLAREVVLLVQVLRGWAGSSWEVPAASGLTRAQRTIRLVGELAVLGERAGVGAPPGISPPRLAPHALPDQVAVLAEELLAVLDVADPTHPPGHQILLDTHAAVTDARADLDGAGFGFRLR
ncbi:conserved hypothetical protein [Frankia sp. AiPs1]|uniref:hypothetical protein n=1 Tax=Frankia sp. AiPa1 TaxID=573492 RepID=UPI00202ACCB1|nr:hypothetical protein [Frankia sp. AiPa1]MCL9758267.1 hypothetical protein [Frankia sp. AiPa1]